MDMTHKVVIVTGANTGIGKRTALHLARMGAKVIMACRSVQKGEDARAELEQEIRKTSTRTSRGMVGGGGDADTPAPQVSTTAEAGVLEVMNLDLADLESVRAFATQFKTKYSRLDVLVNNAGLYGRGAGLTADGLDRVFGVNFVGHFALTLELLSLIQSTPAARVIGLSSVSHRAGSTRWEDAAGGHRRHILLDPYPDSKLAMILFAKELRRRLAAAGSSATAFAVNPGAVRSDIWRCIPSFLMPAVDLLMRVVFLSTDEGCRPSVCASALPLDSLSGCDYYQPYWLPFGCPFPFEVMGVYVGCAPAKPSLPKDEPAASAELWVACERILKTAEAARYVSR